MKDLMNHHKQDGTVYWLGLRPTKFDPVLSVETAVLTPENGLEGDHYSGKSGQRHITLIQKEHIGAVASFLSLDHIDPAKMRRNIVISGLNLLALKGRKFKVGKEVILAYTGECHPCSRMEQNLGKGGYNAMRGHGGITARVVSGGEIRVGDRLTPLD